MYKKPTKKKPTKGKEKNTDQPIIVRLRLPNSEENEILAIVEQRLGGSRMTVRCFDGVRRIARIPGRLKRRLWVRENNIVIIVPWEFSNEKCDIIYKYSRNQTEQLRKKGHLDSLTEVEEF